jgi:hypothetical protein
LTAGCPTSRCFCETWDRVQVAEGSPEGTAYVSPGRKPWVATLPDPAPHGRHNSTHHFLFILLREFLDPRSRNDGETWATRPVYSLLWFGGFLIPHYLENGTALIVMDGGNQLLPVAQSSCDCAQAIIYSLKGLELSGVCDE